VWRSRRAFAQSTFISHRFSVLQESRAWHGGCVSASRTPNLRQEGRMSDKGSVEAVASAIEQYLICNPRAADTASGIRSWWLPEHLRSEPLPTIIDALEALETRGTVSKTLRPGGEVIYSVSAAGLHRT